MEKERRRVEAAAQLERVIAAKKDERLAKKQELVRMGRSRVCGCGRCCAHRGVFSLVCAAQEAEFASVFDEVRSKKDELNKLQRNIEDMEAMRQRKDREFSRLQVCRVNAASCCC